MLHILLLATLLASASALNMENPAVAKTIHAPAPPAPPPPPPPPPGPPGTDLDCTTFETTFCTGGSALHKGMVLGSNTASPNMNSIRCSRDLRDHEQIDLSTHPGMKRDVEGANASEPMEPATYEPATFSEHKRDDDTSCDAYVTTLHGALSRCTAFSRTANCLNLRRDDQR